MDASWCWKKRGFAFVPYPSLGKNDCGADGLDAQARSGASLVLSLGPMTWPHRLVPVLLAEQLFRAESILAGHPYHRE